MSVATDYQLTHPKSLLSANGSLNKIQGEYLADLAIILLGVAPWPHLRLDPTKGVHQVQNPACR